MIVATRAAAGTHIRCASVRHSCERTSARQVVSRGGNPAWIPARAALGRNDAGFLATLSPRPPAGVLRQALRKCLIPRSGSYEKIEQPRGNGSPGTTVYYRLLFDTQQWRVFHLLFRISPYSWGSGGFSGSPPEIRRGSAAQRRRSRSGTGVV